MNRNTSSCLSFTENPLKSSLSSGLQCILLVPNKSCLCLGLLPTLLSHLYCTMCLVQSYHILHRMTTVNINQKTTRLVIDQCCLAFWGKCQINPRLQVFLEEQSMCKSWKMGEKNLIERSSKEENNLLMIITDYQLLLCFTPWWVDAGIDSFTHETSWSLTETIRPYQIYHTNAGLTFSCLYLFKKSL